MKDDPEKARKLRILALEDNSYDAVLMEQALKKSRLSFQLRRACTRDGFLREIDDFCPDLIISDYTLPSYDGLTALEDVRGKGVDIPYIFLSGKIGEESAVETLKRGATDYILKENLPRLAPAIVSAMHRHSERKQIQERKVHDINALNDSEDQLQLQLENMIALNDIAISISSSLDIRVTLNVLLEKLTSLLKVDAADVLLLDQDSLYLNYAAGRGFRTPAAVQTTHVRLGKGLAGKAAYERQPLIISHLSETLTNALKHEEFESYIAMPLMAHGKVKGVLEIFQRKTLEPTRVWMNFLELLTGQAAIAIDNASMFDSLQRFATELTLSYDATLEGWGRTLEFRNEDTKGHTDRVTEMTLRLARILGIADQELVQIRRGALLHDIGKISISDSILLKPGPLTPEEQEIMKLHTVYARELISGIPFLRPAIDIPYCHHEMWDGQGYPRGLKGEDIPFKARLFSIIDVADALISDRPYRAAWPLEKTYQHIRKLKGAHFDPIVVDAFLDMKWEM